MSKAQLIYNKIVSASDPLPDAFGYQYKDTSLERVKDILYSTVSESKEKKSISKAAFILDENRNLINESFMDKLKAAVGFGILNMVRGSLLNWFGVDIDKDSFHRVTKPEEIDTRSPEFKDIQKVYLSHVSKKDKSALAIIHKGKILGIYGDDIIQRGKDTAGSILKKAVSTWWVKSNKKNEALVSFSKAQKLLIG